VQTKLKIRKTVRNVLNGLENFISSKKIFQIW